MDKKFKFTIYDLLVMTLFAALGIALKPVIGPIARMVSGLISMPGGALFGGIYMMFLLLAGGITKKRFSPTLTAFIQALLVIVLGTFGSHGIMSIVTYTLPGLVVDLYLILFKSELDKPKHFIVGGVLANMTGTLLVNFVKMKLPLPALLFALAVAAVSGALGGLISSVISSRLSKIIKR